VLEGLKHYGTEVEADDRVDWRIRQTIEVMKQNLHLPLDVAELGRRVNLSPSRFTHLFRRDLHCPPGRYLRELRLDRARVLVEESALRVKEIMARVGYNDPSHFARDFKQRHGAPPKKVRARARSPGARSQPPRALRSSSRFGQGTAGTAKRPGPFAAGGNFILHEWVRSALHQWRLE
jgi:AraC-like DNA-binding protein